MADLFSPLSIAGKALPNRIVMAPAASGFAVAGGFISDELVAYYARRARGGVGMVISEPLRVMAPPAEEGQAHIGIYADAFVPGLRRLAAAVHAHGALLLLSLDEPAPQDSPDALAIFSLIDSFIMAAWRALCAGADGIMLSSADGGLLHAFVSPVHNRRIDAYGGDSTGRLRLPLEIIEGVRGWLGRRLIIGFRLVAEEFSPGGMSLQDARVIAKRVTSAGVVLLDVTVSADDAATLARFPGWAVPLANGIKRITREVPVIGSGFQGDALLADSVVRDGSIDLVQIDHSLRNDPDWPRAALALMAAQLLP
jgi:2,4-dienoyl-CoA reductase-like NADH-dependent reductase (Old Yellow Enzyme family)